MQRSAAYIVFEYGKAGRQPRAPVSSVGDEDQPSQLCSSGVMKLPALLESVRRLHPEGWDKVLLHQFQDLAARAAMRCRAARNDLSFAGIGGV